MMFGPYPDEKSAEKSTDLWEQHADELYTRKVGGFYYVFGEGRQ